MTMKSFRRALGALATAALMVSFAAPAALADNTYRTNENYPGKVHQVRSRSVPRGPESVPADFTKTGPNNLRRISRTEALPASPQMMQDVPWTVAPVTPGHVPMVDRAYAPAGNPPYIPVVDPAYRPAGNPRYIPVVDPAYVRDPAYAPIDGRLSAPVHPKRARDDARYYRR